MLLDRSRVAAAQLLGAPRPAPPVRPAGEHRSPTAQPSTPDTSTSDGASPAGTRTADPQAQRPSSAALAGICDSIALRDLNLLDALLSQLEAMEAKEEDTDRLAELYQIDHLATRLRRNAENLRVLAGGGTDHAVSETASLVDVVRAAMSAIDHYARITIGRVVSLGVVGFAAEDLSRLLAELLDNAANQSPPNSPVRVSAHLTEQGSILIRIEDEGIGLPPERLRTLNDRLVNAPVLDDDAVRHMGLAVVGRLANRHDIRVSLDRRMPHGTTATVLLPAALVGELPEANWSGGQTVVRPGGATPAAAPVERPASVEPRPAAPVSSTTPAGLPRRAPAAPAPPPAGPFGAGQPGVGQPGARGGVTANGLPRRVSRSLKNPSGDPGTPNAAPPPPTTGGDPDRLLADLDAFTAGEREALDEQRAREADQQQPVEQPVEGNQ
ncbi:Histidine kinase-, DNA gyrase B-, and HSP90-like ATPase [Goodfellowiella coeruleoviolacea]|uniref:histidine kinase n=1 Tax=Goodfellowiella coeruleoviolacea TaxID=334858 RepID=A0AAE3GMA5_9PSEU|nr:Histidine kinase-, DNA gyrase B-, and HSP90-like ATPase [Goodfellowiella coeruleoviolacea]